MEPTKKDFRHVILCHFNQKKSAAQSQRLLVEIYGELAPNISTCQYWFRRFKKGDFNVQDKERSGRPKKFVDEQLLALLNENSAQTTSELAESLGVDKTTVGKRLLAIGKIKNQDK